MAEIDGMKPIIPVLLLLAQLKTTIVSAQANYSLSNLSSTAINVDLVPGSNNARSLGSSSNAWKQVYVNNLLFMGGARFLAYGNAISQQNTGVGSFSIASTTSGYNNTGVGAYTLRSNVSGYNNVAVGFTSLFKSVAGHNNVAVGAASLYNNTGGVSNSAFGNNALLSNTIGSNNMAVGANALYYNTTGYSNVAIGIRALFSNQTGSNQIAIGDSAMLNYNGGVYGGNLAVGSKALYNTTTGYSNIAIGTWSLHNNTTGSSNIAIGTDALYANTGGTYNTAIGHLAATQSVASDLTAVGAYALYGNTSGPRNNAIGEYALYYNTTGGDNTALGYQALMDVTTGSSNVGIGNHSFDFIQTGSGNTGLGSFTVLASPDYYNSTAVGYGAVSNASNQIMLGNPNVTAVKVASSVYLYSDGRFKKDVRETVPGLEFIRALRPVTYHYDVEGIEHHIMPAKSAKGKDRAAGPYEGSNAAWHAAALREKEQKLYSGFVAQEVDSAAKNLHYEFSGLYTPSNEKDLYALSYSDFVVPLVKAVQQLDSGTAKKSKVDSMARAIDALHDTVDAQHLVIRQLEARLEKLETLLQPGGSGVILKNGSLAQNTPNPVRGSTMIAYSLPERYGRAKITIIDMNGRTIQAIPVTGQGAGTLSVNTGSLSAGTYAYSLSVDGIMIGTKQMLVVK